MSGLFRRLVESWLDSASERSYQAPFCQMLLAQGHRVLHSTRHAPLELGKDVITVAPDGVACAYQLKGNPGTRLTLAEYRKIEMQLFELAVLPIKYPGSPSEPHHRSYLVTNGEVQEEVQRAIGDLNESLAKTAAGARVEVISRGRLLSDAQELGSALWPSELEKVDALLRLLVTDGRATMKFGLLHRLLVDVLRLRAADTALKKPEFERRCTSAALVTAVALRKYEQHENHSSILAAWVMCSAYIAAAAERHEHTSSNRARSALELAKGAIFDSLGDLCQELRAREHDFPMEGSEPIDGLFHGARRTHVVGLMALYWLWATDKGWPPDQRAFLTKFLPSSPGDLELWGEGAVPQYLAWLWYLESTDPTIRIDVLWASLVRVLVSECSGPPSKRTLASPYYSAEDVMRHHLRRMLSSPDPLQDETVSNSSFYAEGLFLLLVRLNMKQSCQQVWPELSRLTIRSFVPAEPWLFSLCQCEQGTNAATQLPVKGSWPDMIARATATSVPPIPSLLASDRFLLLLFVLCFPYRVSTDLLVFLGRQFFKRAWYN